ncbi:MAG: Rieske 2Fe-2S domain-containing protein [Actinobacteria bacterium]|nr:Rieske 2Fe-2S domain-containing protein [Actinomycetota bacterium]
MSSLQLSLKKTMGSWRSQAIYIRVIRLWLGITWIYAGWDKASDPGFLTRGSSTFIGSQLTGYASQSPVGFIFNKLIEHSQYVGIIVLLSEFAIGIATLLWIAPTSAAFGGFAMSVGLWLASSFHVKPYFLASDSVYAVLWLTYFLYLTGGRTKVKFSINRRGFMRVGTVGALAVLASGAGKLFPSSATAATSSTAASAGKKLVKLASLPVGGNYPFALASGEQAMLFRTKKGVFAYSRTCTHQGCAVNYTPADKKLVCPCHGATFDPLDGAKVIVGPANMPLPKVKVVIQGNWVVLA